MAHGAHLEILATHPGGVEARPVRIETSPTLGRMTLETITLTVTADARLQALPRRPTVARDKKLFGVVIPRTEPAGSD